MFLDRVAGFDALILVNTNTDVTRNGPDQRLRSPQSSAVIARRNPENPAYQTRPSSGSSPQPLPRKKALGEVDWTKPFRPRRAWVTCTQCTGAQDRERVATWLDGQKPRSHGPRQNPPGIDEVLSLTLENRKSSSR